MTARARLAVIAGASHGIGRATSEHLAAQGYDIVAASRNTSALEELQLTVRAIGQRCDIVPGDLSIREVRYSLRDAIADRRVDALMLAVSALPDADSEASASMSSEERICEVFTTTALVPILLFQLLSGSLRSPGASVVFLGSDWAVRGSEGPPVFSAAKAAIVQFSRTEARYQSKRGIRLSTLILGDVATFNEDWTEPIWTLEDSDDEVLQAFHGARMSLHDVMSTIDLILNLRTAQLGEAYLAPRSTND